ncbi:MAG: RsmE family RNA methyltransferase [Candidatus Dormibacteria bacterium]
MPIFFVGKDQVSPDGEVRIGEPDARHISRVLRARPGEVLRVVADDGTEYEVRLDRLETKVVTGTVVAQRHIRREPRAQIHLLQALPKGMGMGEVCERMAELGASSIWPVITQRSVPRLEPGAAASRLLRWRSITREAAQLAGRHQVPVVHNVSPLAPAVETLLAEVPNVQLFVCHGDELRQCLATVMWMPDQPTALLVGPEGGFSPEEVQQLAARGARPVSLGPRNLRTVLAGVVAATVLLARAGDLEAQAG